jgi:type I restriction enzyme S subunit
MEKIKNIPSLRFPDFKEEWEVKYGNSVFETISNKNHNSDLPILAISQEYGAVPREMINYQISVTDKSVDSYKVVEIGDFIISLRSFQGGIEYSNYLGICSPAYIILRPTIEISNRFFKYFFKTDYYISLLCKKLEGIRDGKMISYKYFSEILLPFPKIEEQNKIASFLTTVDDKLKALKQKKTLLEQYKKGVMQKIFSQELRFKDDNGNNYPDWEETKVKDIFVVTRGNVLSMTLVTNEQDENNLFPVYSSQTKNNGLSGYYDKFLFEDCITWTTDGAGAGDVNFRKGKFYCTNVCGVLKSDKGYANTFVAEILNSVSRKYVSYVGNPKLMNNVMSEIQISIPTSIEEQTKISNFLSAIDEKIDHCQEQIQKMVVWKKGLLQQMFV